MTLLSELIQLHVLKQLQARPTEALHLSSNNNVVCLSAYVVHMLLHDIHVMYIAAVSLWCQPLVTTPFTLVTLIDSLNGTESSKW